MTTETAAAANDGVANLLAAMRTSDSIELKMTVPTSSHRATIAGLPLDPVEAQPRQVFFFDTPDLTLNQAGVVVRARRVQGGRGDTVIKLRPVVPAELPAELRQSAAFNVEVDVLPGFLGVCSGSLKGRITNDEIRDAVAGARPFRKLFTKEQRAFYAQHAPAGIDLDSLSVLGPTFVLKAVFTPQKFGRRIVAEVWLYPDGQRILELSTKCLPNEALQVAADARAYLQDHGVPMGGIQQTKTKTALEFYSAALRAQASSGSTNGASTNGASANGASTNGAKPASTARRRTTTSRAATSRKTAAKR
jgi:hypothetical protein